MTLSHPRFWMRPHADDCPVQLAATEGLRPGETPEQELGRLLGDDRPRCTCGVWELQAQAPPMRQRGTPL